MRGVDEKKTFWQRVVEALAEKGVTENQQTHVARLLQMAQPSVWEWTTGGEPSMKNAKALALKLGVCVEWLLTGRGERRPPAEDALAQELWAMWRHAPDEVRDKIVSYARFTLGEMGPFPAADARPPRRTASR